ncbi:unnamed protein product, partial [marine sediment metagenome]
MMEEEKLLCKNCEHRICFWESRVAINKTLGRQD